MKWALVLGLGLVTTAAYAGRFIDGNDLKTLCDTDANACRNYIEGASDGFGARNGGECPPVGTSSEQVVDSVKKYLADYPQYRTFSGAQLVGFSVQAAWQCAMFPPANARSSTGKARPNRQ